MSINSELTPEPRLWNEGTRGQLPVRRLTSRRPFCAGVLIVHDGKLLTTLSADGERADDAPGTAWNVGGVGGGQEIGEEIWDCARREAREESGVSVELRSSPCTYMHDVDSDELTLTHSLDQPSPFIVQRVRNDDATAPFRSGLPAGPFTYLCMFVAEFVDESSTLAPDDPDIAALVWLPLSAWNVLEEEPTFACLREMGATIAAGGPIADEARVHLPSTETLRTAGPLLAEALKKQI